MNVNIIGNTECIDTGRKDGTHLMRTVGSSIANIMVLAAALLKVKHTSFM